MLCCAVWTPQGTVMLCCAVWTPQGTVMLCCAVLYPTAPYCTIPCWTVLYCTTPYHAELCCTVPYRTVLYCTTPYHAELCCTVPLYCRWVQKVCECVQNNNSGMPAHFFLIKKKHGSMLPLCLMKASHHEDMGHLRCSFILQLFYPWQKCCSMHWIKCLGLLEKKDISVLWPGIEPISQWSA